MGRPAGHGDAIFRYIYSMSMDVLYVAAAIFLLLNVLGGLIRILIGPTRGDRMLAAQLFGTTGVAIILLLAEALERPALRDIALVVVLLAVINTVVFVRFAGRSGDSAGEPGS
jgi:multicomponent Na+:H+ antiporter subunit F